MSEKLPDKEVIVVTGASAGIGRATVRAFARPGACIGLLARGRAGLEAAAKEVEQAGGKALVLPTDMSDPKQVQDAADAVEREFGPIDIWVNDAMVTVFAPVKDMTPEDYKRVTEVNYLGFVYGTLCALKSMLPRDKGVIVQVGSALAYRGIPLQSAYCASKHAIQGFQDSLRSELLHYKSNVKISMVQMPALNTPQFRWSRSKMPRKAQPVPPIFEPEVAARAIVYAARHPKREFYVGWPAVKAIVGNKIAPGYADHYLAESGFNSQMIDEPEDPNRPDNLYEPLDAKEDRGAHGVFDSRAKGSSLEWWVDTHRTQVAALAGVAVTGLVAMMMSGFARK
ncbi:MAG TPA: SDR family oxidoreductase [Chloroflexia bacterium]|nr:SDR family oxidoreductase [Chloroflexia bacterium]